MSKNRFLNQLLATTIICGATMMAAPAYAQAQDPSLPIDTQEQDPAGTSTGPVENIQPEVSATGETLQGEDAEAIVVTGSRIPQPNLTSTSPVTVINSQEIKLQGTTRTEDLINSLPQAFASQGGNIANGATGTATVNLRGLGSSRTLVLINGRRLMPGDPRSPVADINTIPAAIIERVDVLTGGASSVYGADAVAGVVNFVMDTDFEGFRLDGQYSFYNHNNDGRDAIRSEIARRNFPLPTGMNTDGGAIDVSGAIGAGFDDGRGHVTAYATYRKIDEVLQRDRDYSACALSGRTQAQFDADGRLFSCGGSATSANGTFFTNFPNDVFQVGAARNFLPGSTAYNFAPTNYFQRPDERYTFGAFAEYEVSEEFQPFLEVMFMDDRTVAQIAPSGNFGNTLTINCDNPLLSAQQRGLVCKTGNFVGETPSFNSDGDLTGVTGTPQVFINPDGTTFNQAILQPLRRNVEGGGRQDDLQHTSYRLVGGVRGDISPAISYEAFYQYGRVVFAQTYFNDFSVSRLGRALDVITGPDGTPVCRSVVDGSDANCVPYDIFAPGGVTPEALAYLQTPGFSRGNTEETVANASVTAALGEYGLQSPWASEGIGLNVGVEYRKEALQFDTDTAFQTGDLAGQGGATIGVEGSFNVKEVFGEIRVPLIEDRPFFHSLSVGAGYRYSAYTNRANTFNTDTYKFELDFAPVRDIRLRASYNRAVRAPNVVELFAAQSVALDGSTDPCAGPAVGGLVNGNTAAQCALTGVSAAQFGNIQANIAEQYNGLLGGNPNLEPEKATTKTIGLVFTPTFLRGFAATVDYFDIKIENQIGVIGADTILNNCIETGDAAFCDLIVRDQFGSLFRTPNGFVIDTNLNAGTLRTKGIDFGVSYSSEIGELGTLGANVVGTWLDEQSVNGRDCAGLFGPECNTISNGPNPEWRVKTRLTYTSPWGVALSGQWRYFAAVDEDTVAPLPGNARIDAQSFFDLAMTARIGDNYTFRLGANNILDKDPPTLVTPAPFGSGNTYPQVYDALGRYIFAGVTLNF